LNIYAFYCPFLRTHSFFDESSMSSLKYCIKLVLLSILFTPTRQLSPHSYCCRHLKRTISTSSTTITSRTNSHVSFPIKTHLLFQIKSDEDDDDNHDANTNGKGETFADTEKIQSNNKIVPSPIVSFLREKVFLGIEPTPEIIAIMAIYFVEGALGLARLAQTFYLKDELHLGPAELSALTGLFTLPWTIKVSF
jgi:hypothetical protein